VSFAIVRIAFEGQTVEIDEASAVAELTSVIAGQTDPTPLSGSPSGIDRGLLFIAFGRTISTQFEFIFRGWMRNPNFPTSGSGVDALFNFEKQVVCGGYYFVPPLTDPCNPSSWLIPGA
jgi:hypothetical protein